VQPELIIFERFRRVPKQLALRQSRDATLTVGNVPFRDGARNQHRATDLQEISVRIVSSPFCNRLPHPNLEVLNLIGFERVNDGGIVGEIGLG
jgi:hypothetical protein